MLRGPWALALLCVLSGCALPPAVVIARYALDGVSYAVTGKGLTDHAISIALKKDCALFRVVRALEVCVDPVDDYEPRVMVAVLPTDESWGAGVDLAVADPMALSTDLAALTTVLGARVISSEQPPLALLQSPQTTVPAPQTWVEAIVAALAALPSKLPRWSRKSEPEQAQPSLQQASEPPVKPDDSWLWAASRPVRLWIANGAEDGDGIGADPLDTGINRDAMTMAAQTARPSARVDYRRPRAKPDFAELATVRSGEEAQRAEALMPMPAPVIVAANPRPRALNSATAHSQTQLATLAACRASSGVAACGNWY